METDRFFLRKMRCVMLHFYVCPSSIQLGFSHGHQFMPQLESFTLPEITEVCYVLDSFLVCWTYEMPKNSATICFDCYVYIIYIYTHTYPSDFPAEITHQNTFRPTSRLVMKPWLAQAPAEVDRVSSCPGWHVLMCMSY